MRLADALAYLIQRIGDGLLGHAPEVAEFEDGTFEFVFHPPRGFRQFQPGGGLGLDRIAPHLVEHDPQGNAGDGRGNRDAEVLYDLLGRARRGKLIERDGETGQREQESHVVEIVSGLVVAQAEQPRPEQARIADHDQDRDSGRRQRAEIMQFREDDVAAAEDDHAEEDEPVEEAGRQIRFEVVTRHGAPLGSLQPFDAAKRTAVVFDPGLPELHVLGAIHNLLVTGLPSHVAEDDGGAVQVGTKLQIGRRLLIALERQIAGPRILAVILGVLDHVGDNIERFSGIFARGTGELPDRNVLYRGHDRRTVGLRGGDAVFHGFGSGFAEILDPTQPRNPRIIRPFAQARAVPGIAFRKQRAASYARDIENTDVEFVEWRQRRDHVVELTQHLAPRGVWQVIGND